LWPIISVVNTGIFPFGVEAEGCRKFCDQISSKKLVAGSLFERLMPQVNLVGSRA